MGRVREIKWGPRVIDLDLLYMEDLILYSPDLILPHPYVAERAFVLESLNELPLTLWILSKENRSDNCGRL